MTNIGLIPLSDSKVDMLRRSAHRQGLYMSFPAGSSAIFVLLYLLVIFAVLEVVNTSLSTHLLEFRYVALRIEYENCKL